MTVKKKNTGRYIPYELSGTTLCLRDGALTLDLAQYQRDDPVHLDISEDAAGRLVVGPSYRYIAELDIPARAYALEKGAYDDFGFPQLYKHAIPLETKQATLTLWALEV
jgi:hypothetical protein